MGKSVQANAKNRKMQQRHFSPTNSHAAGVLC